MHQETQSMTQQGKKAKYLLLSARAQKSTKIFVLNETETKTDYQVFGKP